MTATPNPARLAVDIGGTFTDVVLEANGRQVTIKVLTTPDDPERGVIEGIGKVMAEAGAEPAEVGLIIHGTSPSASFTATPTPRTSAASPRSCGTRRRS
jgi:N-methylhydantoinase A